MNQYIRRLLFERIPEPKNRHYFLCGIVCIVFSPILIPMGVLYLLYKAIEELGWIVLGGVKP